MEGWDRLWQRDDIAAAWQKPDPVVLELASRFGVRRAYDLGCGVGRHTVALAAAGVDVVATDLSPSGLVRTRRALVQSQLRASLACGAMTAAPVRSESVDLVVAYHVLYHGTSDQIAAAVGEIRRIVCPGGHAYFSLISANDSKLARLRQQAAAGEAEELEPSTYRRPDAEGDDFLPHHFTDEAELRGRFLRDFDVLDVEERRRDSHHDPHEPVRRRAHWHVLARRP
jgi:SAM-dependent methyltransferase